MPQTPLSASTPYCTVSQLILHHDWQQVADRARDGDTDRPAKADLSNTGTDAGLIVAAALLAATGDLESACLVGKRYTPSDLAGLTGASAARLQEIVAHLAFWKLSQRRLSSSADPKTTPGASQALEELDRLRDGQRIFAFTESAEAGLPETIDPEPDSESRLNGVVHKARRLFGHRSRDDRRV